jgi:hypothetical protein
VLEAHADELAELVSRENGKHRLPYDHGVSAAFTATLDADDSLTADDQAAISHRNAQALFPGWPPTWRHLALTARHEDHRPV